MSSDPLPLPQPEPPAPAPEPSAAAPVAAPAAAPAGQDAVSAPGLALSEELFDAAERLARAEVGLPGEHSARWLLHRAGAQLARPGAPPGELSLRLDGPVSPEAAAGARRDHLAAIEALRGPQAARSAAARGTWLRLSLALLVATATALGCWWAYGAWKKRGELLAGKPWVASSEGLKCDPKNHLCGGTRTDIFFHTVSEADPWIRYDLGAPTRLGSLRVVNRQDMGLNRCIPLVAEVSDDQASWREVARATAPFATWSPSFAPVTARYLRLRVAGRTTWLHLEAVEAYP